MQARPPSTPGSHFSSPGGTERKSQSESQTSHDLKGANNHPIQRKQAELDDLDNVVQESPRLHMQEQQAEG